MSKLEVGKDFMFRFPSETNKQEGYSIEFTAGDFAGVSFKYGEVSVQEDEEKQEASLVFEFDVIESNGIENLEQNEDFKNAMGNVLMSIIEEGIAAQTEEKVVDEN